MVLPNAGWSIEFNRRLQWPPYVDTESPNTILKRILGDSRQAPAPVSDLVCPDCGKPGIKSGSRKTGRGRVQRLYCRSCDRNFCASPLPRRKYSASTVLETVTTYNLGRTIADTKNTSRGGAERQCQPARYIRGSGTSHHSARSAGFANGIHSLRKRSFSRGRSHIARNTNSSSTVLRRTFSAGGNFPRYADISGTSPKTAPTNCSRMVAPDARMGIFLS